MFAKSFPRGSAKEEEDSSSPSSVVTAACRETKRGDFDLAENINEDPSSILALIRNRARFHRALVALRSQSLFCCVGKISKSKWGK